MISSGLQLYSWFVSVLIGFIYASFLNLFIRYNNRKSIPLSYIEEKGHILKDGYNPLLDYLKIIDDYLGEI